MTDCTLECVDVSVQTLYHKFLVCLSQDVEDLIPYIQPCCSFTTFMMHLHTVVANRTLMTLGFTEEVLQ